MSCVTPAHLYNSGVSVSALYHQYQQLQQLQQLQHRYPHQLLAARPLLGLCQQPAVVGLQPRGAPSVVVGGGGPRLDLGVQPVPQRINPAAAKPSLTPFFIDDILRGDAGGDDVESPFSPPPVGRSGSVGGRRRGSPVRQRGSPHRGRSVAGNIARPWDDDQKQPRRRLSTEDIDDEDEDVSDDVATDEEIEVDDVDCSARLHGLSTQIPRCVFNILIFPDGKQTSLK